MSKFLKWIAVPAVLAAGMLFAAPSAANAQGFSIGFGSGYGGYGYGGYGYAPRRSGVSFYYSNFPRYSSYYAPRVRAYYPAPVYYYPGYGPRCW